MNPDIQDYDGACLCGAVRFRVKPSDGLHSARRCTCSLCRMRGAIAVSAAAGDLTVTQGEDRLSLYQFNSKVAKHYFCSVCGIYTHHRRRSNPSQYGVNVACLEGINPFDFAAVEVLDGVRYPLDYPDDPPDTQVGVLRFERSTSGN